MIDLYIGNNLDREKHSYDPDETLRSAFETYGIDYSMGMNTLDGATLKPGDLDKTFKEMGVTSSCYLLNIKKSENA